MKTKSTSLMIIIIHTTKFQIVEVEYDFRGRNYPGIVQRIAVLKISKTPQGNEYDVFHF